MPRLSHGDFALAQKVLLELYQHLDLETLPKSMISVLRRTVPCEISTYNEMDVRGQQMRAVHDYPTNEAEKLFPRLMANLHEHPVFQYWSATREPGPAKISDFISQRQFERLALYHEFYRVFGIRYQMDFSLAECGGVLIALGLQRTHRDFNERDRAAMKLLMPHCTQAFKNAEAFSGIRQAEMQMKRGLTLFNQGIILLNKDGKVLSMAPECGTWLRQFWGRTAPGAALPEALQRWLKAQRAPANPLAQVRAPLQLQNEQGLLAVRWADCDEGILLLLTFQRSRASEVLLRFGLTPRERDVLHWLAQGKKNPEIATILGISHRTVQKHFERIFSKLGVENREAALVKCLKG